MDMLHFDRACRRVVDPPHGKDRQSPPAGRPSGHVVRPGNADHPGVPRVAITDHVEVHALQIGQDNHVFVLESEVFLPHVLQLFVHGPRADHQQDGHGELGDHEGFAQCRGARARRPAEDRRGTDPGQQQGGVGPGEDAGRQDDGGAADDRPRFERRHGKHVARHGPEDGQDHPDGGQGHEEGRGAQEDGFAQELPDDLPSRGAGDLAHADFPGPGNGPDDRQVREIHAGDQQDQDRDGDQHPDERHLAVHFHLQLQLRVQVDVEKRLQDIGVGEGRFPDRGVDVLLEPCLQHGVYPAGRYAVRQEQVGVVRAVRPVPQQADRVAPARRRGDGYIEIGMIVGIGFRVFHDGGNREGKQLVAGDRPADRVVLPEVLAGHGLADDHRIRRRERGGGVAAHQGHVEHVEEVAVGPVDPLLVELPVFGREQPGPHRRSNAEHFLRLGKPGPDEVAQDPGRPRRAVRHNPVDPLSPRVVPVVAQLVADVQEDDQAAGHADGEADDVDRGVGPGREDVPPRGEEVMSDHGLVLPLSSREPGRPQGASLVQWMSMASSEPA